MDLKEIYQPIRSDLTAMESRLQGLFRREKDEYVASIGRYVMRSPGKRLRPALVLLAAKLGRAKKAEAIELAATVELIHTATLIHDDIIDNAKMRRNQPAVNQKFGRDAAILFGDYLYSKAFEIVTTLRSFPINLLLLQNASLICQGEMHQLSKAFKPKLGEKEYVEIISNKTASLFATCCEAGGLLGKISAPEAVALKNYGHNLGVSFQIIDDCLDVAGDAKKVGKSLKLDAKNGKITLPGIFLNKFPKESKEDALRYATGVASKFGDSALKAIGTFENNRARQSFEKLIGYVIGQVSIN